MRVLVAEDNAVLGTAIQVSLEKEGYSVDLVENGLDAEELTDVFDHDLIITDIMMPKLSAIQLIEKLMNRKSKNIPIIVMSELEQNQLEFISRTVGANTYLNKPFNIKQLIDTVNATLRPKMNSSRIVELIDLTKLKQEAFNNIYVMEEELKKKKALLETVVEELRKVNVQQSSELSISLMNQLSNCFESISSKAVCDRFNYLYNRVKLGDKAVFQNLDDINGFLQRFTQELDAKISSIKH